MAAIGADPEALDDLAVALRSASGDLHDAVGRIDATLQRATWTGADADRFRRSWRTGHRRALSEVSDRCRSLAGRVVAHAAEQRRAAATTGRSSGPSRLAPLPREVTVHRGVLSGSYGPLSASLTGTLSVTEQGDRRRVTYSDDVAAGVGVSAGTGFRASWGDRVVGTGTTAAAGAGVSDRVTRTWVVDEADMGALLVGLAAEQGLSHSPLGAVDRAVTQGVRALDALGGIVGLGLGATGLAGPVPLPDPVRTEDVVGVEVGAATWATLAGSDAASPAGVDGTVGARLGVGTVAEGDRRSILVEADGAAATALLRSSPVLSPAAGPAASTATSLRLEVPLGGEGGRPVLVTWTGRGDGGDRIVRLAVDPAAAAPVARAAHRLGNGDVTGAVDALRDLRPLPGAVEVDVTEVRTDVTRADAEVVGGAVSVEVSGTTERRRSVP